MVGWKGTLSVWQLNVRDIRPVASERYHLPPSAHTTFLAAGVAICTFAPRPLENGDPRAMKVPFYHSNIDYDEVLFYHSGEFFSRAGVNAGMLTFHPQGIHHGPQARAAQRTSDAQRTEEIAVMIDTRQPLAVGAAAAREVERLLAELAAARCRGAEAMTTSRTPVACAASPSSRSRRPIRPRSTICSSASASRAR